MSVGCLQWVNLPSLRCSGPLWRYTAKALPSAATRASWPRTAISGSEAPTSPPVGEPPKGAGEPPARPLGIELSLPGPDPDKPPNSGGQISAIARSALTERGVGSAFRASFDARIVCAKARIDRQSTSDEHRTRSRRLLPSNLLHSSGSPALRRPSSSGGTFIEWVCCHLRVNWGLRRRASAKADAASSILPSSA